LRAAARRRSDKTNERRRNGEGTVYSAERLPIDHLRGLFFALLDSAADRKGLAAAIWRCGSGMDHLHRFLSMYVGRRLPLRSFVDFEAFGTSQTLVHYCVVLSSFLLVWRSQSSSALLLAGNEPLGGSETVVAIFRALAELVGTPYFVLASLGPLLQAWIYSEGTDAFPYRYFAVSNLGPLLALISYPTVVQPFLPTNRQFKAFSIAYVIVVLASLFLAPNH
jgi:hypothetical protein